MRTYSHFLSLLVLIALWSIFYSGVKYFFWGVFADSGFHPTLEMIAGYILLGSSLAYVIGGPIYARFREKNILACSVFFGLMMLVLGFFLGENRGVFALSTIGIGLAYGLYVVGKNMLVGREMSNLSLSSTVIGGIATIIFIASMIGGTVVGAGFGQGNGMIGFFVFLGLLASGLLATLFLRPEGQKVPFSLRESLAGYTKMFARFGYMMIALGLLWQISTEAAQLAVGYSTEAFGKTNMQASALLIFSSIGAVFGNIISMKLPVTREKGFLILGTIFMVLVFGFSFILQWAHLSGDFLIVQMLALALGLVFGGAVNIAESYFLQEIGKDTNGNYGSALYGFLLSILGSALMFTSHFLHTNISFHAVSIFLGICSVVALIGAYRGLER